MLFNSLHFLFFFPVVVLLFFALKGQVRVYWLIAASCYFYMAFVPAYILILFVLILLDYAAGLMIAKSHGAARRLWLVLSIVGNVAMLGFYKYFNFLDQNIAALAQSIGMDYAGTQMNIILPIGLSFHTFQSMSYVFEVYRGRQSAEHNLAVYSLYVLFFPQMVAGPIERPQNLLTQLRRLPHFDHERTVDGLVTMGIGFFKKLVVADRFAIVVDTVYRNPSAYSSADLVLASYCFAFQIYCDFSGYSDIAIGAARIMGYDLMKNFERPYAARSIADFWKRWHISLSTWFRDYVYIPLGGNRVSKWKWYRNLLFVFMLSGLWHGANWTFVCWGALHGMYLVVAYWTEPMRARIRSLSGLESMPRVKGALQVVITFHLVLVGWVFFRAGSVGDAFTILARVIGGGPAELSDVGLTTFDLLVGFGALALLELFQWFTRQKRLPDWIRPQPIWVRWPAYYLLVSLVIVLGKFSSQQFIYFQF
jgi:D-alanyl-lipoteichoic acid acyltransferase DltB (MBOAT superfamily)